MIGDIRGIPQLTIGTARSSAQKWVPEVVPSEHVIGAYVSGEAGRAALHAIQPPWGVTVDSHLFFR
jgi:hypothetical protein